ncbi:hypothetical protein [Streptomyces sp. S.PB5]|uniref:hypothetical protein n=1 Tax=Streptomyces sp. S.PB5 TaxID=3020844 RepID=UPI0025B07E8F|nr:hypothetical protein [Streptomyces sp. S.PB5]MDN3022626.1 hypothetical protein [Streptomyces sp. S.PB5]
MDLIFYAAPSLILVVVAFIGYRVVHRSLQLRTAWNSGLTAEGRCLRVFTTTHGGGHDTSVRTTLHHVYEFTARDGRTVRFEEEDGPRTVVEGDFVTIHYAEGASVVATAKSPSHGKLAASTVFVLAFLGVAVVFCIGFMVTYSQMSDEFGFGDDSGNTGEVVVVDGETLMP